MTRLGENVFQFRYGFGSGGWDWAMPFLPLAPGAYLILMAILSGLGGEVGWILLGIFLGIPLLVFGISYCKRIFRYYKSGVILDNEKGVITLHKWTFKGPLKIEEIQINEIMGVDRDIDITTETRLVNQNSNNAHWQTTERRSYNVVLQGKFGSKRFKLAYQDDWNLFMTLLYGDAGDTE